MKKYSRIIFIVILALIAGMIIGRLHFGERNVVNGTEQTEPEAGTIWTCSMHPSIRQSEPGDCPICGMDLIPLTKDGHDHTDPAVIQMSDAAMALADIITAPVTTGKAVKTIRMNGVVERNERQVNVLSSHIVGRIEDLAVDFTGQTVEKGQVIASVYSPELATAQEELLAALSQADERPLILEAAKEKLRNWKLSEQQINEMIASGKPWGVLPVLADRSGVVTGKLVNRGDYVHRGQTLYELSDLGTVWMLLDVYESDIAWLQTGDPVEIAISALPGRSFSGTVDFIDPLINAKTRVAKARVILDNAKGLLKPGMYGTGIVAAKQENNDDLPVIPASAVMWTGKRSLVYVRQEENGSVGFKMREVTLGPRLDDAYVVTAGLEPGELIAVNGTFSLDAAAQLSGKPSMMDPEGGAFRGTHDHGTMAMTDNMTSQEEHGTMQALPEVSPDAQRALLPVIEAYLGLKDALVGDAVKPAKRHVLNLKEALETIDMKPFEGEAHAVFMSAREKILAHLPDKKQMKDIERIRAAFEYISYGMIDLLRQLPLPEDIFYVQHCPMAFNNKGADWISREHEIRNPYFGASMLTCGDVTDTLKIK